ncbi:hypothetical protein A359_04520 [secondary endosymbiont of Ctenarytaina eucalypti]|uniref:Uncharacterized protein n=1 Tax=secondary endosymbiont of Ctenarytaina eucalypti TaxID=1199245 RepID=J3TXE7_9ENTR|nr:hypothetical protein A359_04520 [secondary endosymbiont of Ctenarytaina eucalypti]
MHVLVDIITVNTAESFFENKYLFLILQYGNGCMCHKMTIFENTKNFNELHASAAILT